MSFEEVVASVQKRTSILQKHILHENILCAKMYLGAYLICVYMDILAI